MTNGACPGYFIRDLPAATEFALNQAFALEDDVGPNSLHVTGQQIQNYFDARYVTNPLSDDLDVGTFSIVSTGNDDIRVTPGGSGELVLDNLRWPAADGTANQILATDGAGQLFFKTESGGGGGDFVPWDPTTGLATVIKPTLGSRILIGDATTGAAVTGTDCLLIGQSAGEDLTSGTNVIAIGASALAENITGARLIAIGNEAGRGVTGNSHSDNTFIGYRAGYSITTSPRNVAIGSEALFSLAGTPAEDNVAIGDEAARNATGIIGGTFIGTRAGYQTTGANNVAIGKDALRYNTTGKDNFALGAEAISLPSIANNNVAIGQQALRSSQGATVIDNVFVGYVAGFECRGIRNLGLGYRAGARLTSGNENTFIGYRAGEAFTSGAKNVCIGFHTGLSGPNGTEIGQLWVHHDLADENNTTIFAKMPESIMKINARLRVTGEGTMTADPRAELDVIQAATAGARPALILDQDDVSEEFVRLYGSAAAATLTQSLVNAADVTTPTVAGYMKVNIQDEGNQITDGAYYVPFYSIA